MKDYYNGQDGACKLNTIRSFLDVYLWFFNFNHFLEKKEISRISRYSITWNQQVTRTQLWWLTTQNSKKLNFSPKIDDGITNCKSLTISGVKYCIMIVVFLLSLLFFSIVVPNITQALNLGVFKEHLQIQEVVWNSHLQKNKNKKSYPSGSDDHPI